MEWRRDRVLELSSQGFSQSEIATVLYVDKSIISRDMAYLRHRARENLKQHIHQTIPEEYQKACQTLNQVLRMTWSIVGKTEDEKRNGCCEISMKRRKMWCKWEKPVNLHRMKD
jgi:hypothetical protein